MAFANSVEAYPSSSSGTEVMDLVLGQLDTMMKVEVLRPGPLERAHRFALTEDNRTGFFLGDFLT